MLLATLAFTTVFHQRNKNEKKTQCHVAVHRDDAVCGLESSCGWKIDESTRWENMVVYATKIVKDSGLTLWKIAVFNGKLHYFDWAMFNSYVKLPNYQRVIRQNWETPLTSQNWEDWKLDRSKPKRQNGPNKMCLNHPKLSCSYEERNFTNEQWIWVNYNILLSWIVGPFGDDSPY